MTYFARNTSGLRREFRTLDVFIFNVLAYAIGVSLVITPPLLGGTQPRANLWIVLTLGLVLSIFNGLTYGLMSAAMPRSGGDYVFISRSLSPAIGFTASFGFLLSQVLGIGLYAGLSVRDAMGSALAAIANVTGQSDLLAISSKLSQPAWRIAGGALILLIVCLVSLRGLRVLKSFLKFFFVLAMLGVASMAVVLLRTSHEEFVALFNEFMARSAKLPHAYAEVLRRAQAAGLEVGASWSFWASLRALPIGYLAFVGFTYSVYMGGEVESPGRSQPRGIVGALIFGCAVFFLVLGRLYEVVGQDFLNALPLLSAHGVNPVPSDGSVLLLVNLMTSSRIVQGLICVGFFLWFFLLLFVMSQSSIRILFAWAMDLLAPRALAQVNAKAASPNVATITILVAALVGLVISSLWGTALINYVALFSVCFLFSGIAAVVFPWRRRDLFDRSPREVRDWKVGSIPVLSIVGVGNTVLFVIVLTAALTETSIGGTTGGIMPIIIVLGTYSLGAIWYGVARRGVEDAAVLHEALPPGDDDEDAG
jgi:amino acid transporter